MPICILHFMVYIIGINQQKGMERMEKFTYLGEPNCHFEPHRYCGTNNLALCIVDSNGEQYCVASVNIANKPLSDDRIAIKNWSENEGVDTFLKKLGIIGAMVDFVISGFVDIPIYELTEKGKAIFKEV